MARKSEGKRITAEFFQYANGSKPVREWLLNELSDEERRIVGADIAVVEFEWPVGPPLVKKVGELWEVRTVLARGWARVVFVVEDGKMILLHGLIKKSKKPVKSERDVAIKRLSILKKDA